MNALPTASASASRATPPDLLSAANINPQTGLASDYLNHFHEAIMILGMIPELPSYADDFLEWRPASYVEHFRQSNLKTRDLAIAAYEAAPAETRREFDATTDNLISILLAIQSAMKEAKHDSSRSQLAAEAMGWLKPQIKRASQIINPGQTAEEVLVENPAETNPAEPKLADAKLIEENHAQTRICA